MLDTLPSSTNNLLQKTLNSKKWSNKNNKLILLTRPKTVFGVGIKCSGQTFSKYQLKSLQNNRFLSSIRSLTLIVLLSEAASKTFTIS